MASLPELDNSNIAELLAIEAEGARHPPPKGFATSFAEGFSVARRSQSNC